MSGRGIRRATLEELKQPPRFSPREQLIFAASSTGLGLLDVFDFVRDTSANGRFRADAGDWVELTLGLVLLACGFAFGRTWWRERGDQGLR